jgi:hypothetical protein
MNDLEERELPSMVLCWEPQRSPLDPRGGELELVSVLDFPRLPTVGHVITFTVPTLVDQVRAGPAITGYGRVEWVEQNLHGQWIVCVTRIRDGMTFAQLYDAVHQPVLAFHPVYGPIQGRLESVVGLCELAAVRTLDVPPQPGDAEERGDQPGVLVWCDWTTIVSKG